MRIIILLAIATIFSSPVVAAEDGIAEDGYYFSLEDKTSEGKIVARLLAEKDMPSKGLSVYVFQGVAHVIGVVETPDQLLRATYIARDYATDAIMDVFITQYAMEDFLADSYKTASVEAKMISSPELKNENISVETLKGVVYLMGVVNRAESIYEAEKLAESVYGVEKVVNYISIVGQKPPKGEEDS